MVFRIQHKFTLKSSNSQFDIMIISTFAVDQILMLLLKSFDLLLGTSTLDSHNYVKFYSGHDL